MAQSQVQICNLALMRVGVSLTISSLDEGSAESRVLSAAYTPTLERVLTDKPWPFATRFANLEDVGSPPTGWAYRYRYPNDCIGLRRLMLSVDDLRTDYPYQIVEDAEANALAICTNLEVPIAEYTARITQTSLFTPQFVNALAWALAAEIAIPLSANIKLGVSAGEQYSMALDDAFAGAMNEQVASVPRETEWVAVRR